MHGVKEADFLYLLRESNLSKGNLSSHLLKLQQAGYIEIAKTYRGKVPLTIIRLTKAGRAAFEGYHANLSGLLSKAQPSGEP